MNPTQSDTTMRETLEWYAEQVAGCRKITSDGDKARNALDADGGKRARAAIAAMSAPAGEAQAIIKELNECYLFGMSEKSDRLAQRIMAILSAPAEPVGDGVQDAFMRLCEEVGIPVLRNNGLIGT